jgi:hypothetical protein
MMILSITRDNDSCIYDTNSPNRNTHLNFIEQMTTELRSRAVSISAWYLGGPGSKLGPDTTYTDCFRGIRQSL